MPLMDSFYRSKHAILGRKGYLSLQKKYVFSFHYIWSLLLLYAEVSFCVGTEFVGLKKIKMKSEAQLLILLTLQCHQEWFLHY